MARAAPFSSQSVNVTVRGDAELARLLRNISPEKNPQWVTEALRKSSKVVRKNIRKHIQGPRPRKLGVVSGWFLSSIKNVRERYPYFVRVGTDINFMGKYEFGPARLRKPFLAPAEEDSFFEILEIFTEVSGRVVRHG